VVLERAGYTLDEMEHVLKTGDYPAAMLAFEAELETLESVGAVAERVLARYGYDGTYADVVVETVQDAFDATTMTRGDLVRFVERGIEEGATREVSAPAGTDAVTVQTIHAAKGLEYPIVVLANMNRYTFPPSGGGSSTVAFDDPIGLRQGKVYAEENGHAHVFDNWHADVLRKCLPNEYDEERRLLYVAMTRAESHLVFTAGEEPNTFLEELPVTVEELEPDVQEHRGDGTVQTALDISVPMPEGPVGWNPHQLMSDEVFEGVTDGEGTEFGTAVHEFAEKYAKGEDVEPSNADEVNVADFIDSLDGTYHVETEAYLPMEVDGETITLSGVVDLVVESATGIEIYDFKTDRGRHAEEEYRKQLSGYYHVLANQFPDRSVSTTLFYTEAGELIEVEPLSESRLANLVTVVGNGRARESSTTD
jgi:ATP-dependent exoDNAse (exonuclease V) beta subunit